MANTANGCRLALPGTLSSVFQTLGKKERLAVNPDFALHY
jgi:hypothetical protein